RHCSESEPDLVCFCLQLFEVYHSFFTTLAVARSSISFLVFIVKTLTKKKLQGCIRDRTQWGWRLLSTLGFSEQQSEDEPGRQRCPITANGNKNPIIRMHDGIFTKESREMPIRNPENLRLDPISYPTDLRMSRIRPSGSHIAAISALVVDLEEREEFFDPEERKDHCIVPEGSDGCFVQLYSGERVEPNEKVGCQDNACFYEDARDRVWPVWPRELC
ncbi:hypothetical protein V8F33_005516, partial [Rhypophila sp. PSN 637]